jgi:hypothetical protein
VILQGSAHFALEVRASADSLVHFGPEISVTTPPVGLGPIERNIGSAGQLLLVLRIARRKRHAYAHADVNQRTIDDIGFANLGDDPLTNPLDSVTIPGIVQDDRKLMPPSR